MSKQKHYPPIQAKEEFHCPHCGVFAKQFWAHLHAREVWGPYNSIQSCEKFDENLNKDWTISKCEHCKEHAFWFQKKMINPKIVVTSQPNGDLNEEIKKDYLEAAKIFSESPRATAALLRLCLQKLCKQLGETGENINTDIGNLVSKGLNPLVQKSLDSLRITGNNAVHPGEINLEEEPEKVIKLFELINFIAEKMISEPKEITTFYEMLPETAKEAVEKRDAIK